MNKAKDTFPKIIHLPNQSKQDLEVMAIRKGFGNLKNMVESIVIEELDKYNNEPK